MTPNPTPETPRPGEFLTNTGQWKPCQIIGKNERCTMIRVEYSNDYLVPHKEVRNATPATGSETPTPERIVECAAQEGPTPREDCFKALQCMYLACESQVADDVSTKVKAFVATLERQLAESQKQCAQLRTELAKSENRASIEKGKRMGVAEQLAVVTLERNALLQMAWLDLPDDPRESTAKWQELFRAGWERKDICELLRTDLATLERQLAESRAENERLKAELEGHAFELSPAMVQARNDQLNADNAALRAERDRLTAECEKDLTWISNFLGDLIAGRALRPTQIRIGLEMRRDSLRSVLTAAKPEERV